jgi:formylglycine-generating enzyme required for sulfatase activity
MTEKLCIAALVFLLSLSGCRTEKKTETIPENRSSAAMEFVFVKGGTFPMGCNNSDSDEKPIHTVTVSDFYIGKYEVTQKQWCAVMGNNPSRFSSDDLPSLENISWKVMEEFIQKKLRAMKENYASVIMSDNYPVENVSWNDVQEFIHKLNQKEGTTAYRLPTEAEWEYAAGGGHLSHGFEYSGGDTVDNVAWHQGNSGRRTHDVGTKRPNELGIYDMSGNVWELCSDWFDAKYYIGSPSENPQGPASGQYRVMRGGSWSNSSYDDLCRVAYRDIFPPDARGYNCGLRLVKTK